MYDKDQSGTIEMAEMVEVLETVYVMEGVTSGNMAKVRAQAIFSELDIDGDGTLSCDEFVRGCMKDKQMVSMLNRDGKTEEEIEASGDPTPSKVEEQPPLEDGHSRKGSSKVHRSDSSKKADKGLAVSTKRKDKANSVSPSSGRKSKN
jgi:hypothetical protein